MNYLDSVKEKDTENELDERGLGDKPILTIGSGGPAVLQLAETLHALGFETSVSRGENAFGILDTEMMTQVREFRRQNDVAEDAQAFGGELQADDHIGPQTWAALRDQLADKVEKDR